MKYYVGHLDLTTHQIELTTSDLVNLSMALEEAIKNDTGFVGYASHPQSPLGVGARNNIRRLSERFSALAAAAKNMGEARVALDNLALAKEREVT